MLRVLLMATAFFSASLCPAATLIEPRAPEARTTTEEQIIRQFADVVFGAEHGQSATIIRRWTTAPSIALFASPEVTGELPISRVLEGLEVISRLTGLVIDATASPDQATLRVGFFPRSDFAALPATKGADRAEYDRFVRTSACLGIAATSDAHPGAIQKGIILIGSDIPASLQNHCILEELVQIMGLPNDACNYSPSLFCESDYVEELTASDQVLLQALYDERMAPGMEREAALALVGDIIHEILENTAQRSAGADRPRG